MLFNNILVISLNKKKPPPTIAIFLLALRTVTKLKKLEKNCLLNIEICLLIQF